uniref:Uncharacterized protein n=1 Tax=Gopherus evgoodei TaxID=1825980 RepID=A0A8C4W7Y0_9SAUR
MKIKICSLCAGLTQSPTCFMRCIRRGGLCYRRCPPGTYYLGRCCRQFFCCRRVSAGFQ